MSSDLRPLRARLLAHIVLHNPPVHEPNPPSAATTLVTLAADGTWPDIDYGEAKRSHWKARAHLERTRSLAHYAVSHDNADYRAAALSALAWWVARDPINPNWWHNQIGCPRLLVEILLLLEGHVPAALFEASRPLLDRSGNFLLCDDGSRKPAVWTGANGLWMAAIRLLAGAVFDDEPQAIAALDVALSEIRVSPWTEEGIQADASFHQHGPLLYNGGYGLSFLTECLFFLSVTHGTRWQPELRYHEILADFLLDGTRWMLRGADFNHGCRDREITRVRHTNTGIAPLAAFLASAGLPRRAELEELAAAITSETAPGGLAGNRMFYRSDFMVQQSAQACLSVRMHSSRTVRGECTNAEGLLSHHLADGLTYLTKTGAEYRDVFPVWDWQKLPGITCLQTPRDEPWQTVRRHGSTVFVGGVSDGCHGACTQHILSEHLDARKSWFFGPDGMLCLGAGISSSYAGPVITALDQSLRQGTVETDTRAGALMDGTHALSGVRWLRHGPWGFVFPERTDVTIELARKTGAWSRIGPSSDEPVSRDLFLAYLKHGDAPENAGYAYLVTADADRDSLEKTVARPGFEILANTTTRQAVWWAEAQLLQAVFFQPGELTWDGWTLRVDRECSVQVTEAFEATRYIYIADVRQDGGNVQVELRNAAGAVVHQATVGFPTGDEAGKTVRVG